MKAQSSQVVSTRHFKIAFSIAENYISQQDCQSIDAAELAAKNEDTGQYGSSLRAR